MTTWRVARSLDVLLGQLNAAFPKRSKVSDGSIGDAEHATRDSDHNPHCGGVVTARDFTHDPDAGCDIARLAAELAASRDPRIKYVICNARIMDSRPGFAPWAWKTYSGTNPHSRHLHLSVVCGPLMDDDRAWDLPMLRGDDDMPTPEQLWNHRIPDWYVSPTGAKATPKAAFDLLSWAATHAAYAKEQATAANAKIDALTVKVDELMRRHQDPR